MRNSALFACLILAISSPLGATTYIVNPDGSSHFPTIQAAIDDAQDGDLIILIEGTFVGDGNRDLDYLGKAITIRSLNGDPRMCIIDPQGTAEEPHRGFHFHCGEGSTSILSDLTITNAYAAGIDDDRVGGALACFNGSSPRLTNIIFSGNQAYFGGGANCTQSSPTFTNCTFVNNYAIYGGGLNCFHGNPHVTQCTFHNNAADYGGGVRSSSSHPILANTIVAACSLGVAVRCENGEATLACCNVFGNAGGDWVGCIASQLGIAGNIQLSPLFCNPAEGDFHLQESSPCAPFSSPNQECELIGAWPVGCANHDFACCFDYQCQVLPELDCIAQGGTWAIGIETCEPNPCPRYACCTDQICQITDQEECDALGGDWMSGQVACDPNPCAGLNYIVHADGSGDYPTIQAALDALREYDTILLTNGVYMCRTVTSFRLTCPMQVA